MRKASKSKQAYLANPKLCKECNDPIPYSRYGTAATMLKSFCNRSCSATYNDRVYHRRSPKVIRKCQGCGGDIVGVYRDRHNFRGSYYKPWHPECYKNRTELANSRSISSINDKTLITCMSRNLMKKVYANSFYCWVCSYSTIVEVCHIKAVGSFSPDTSVGVVNAIDNLLLLCPNHHKELDRGMMKVSDVTRP